MFCVDALIYKNLIKAVFFNSNWLCCKRFIYKSMLLTSTINQELRIGFLNFSINAKAVVENAVKVGIFNSIFQMQ